MQLSEFGPQPLGKAEAFRLFRQLVNYDPATVEAARLTYDTHLDYFVADSAIDCHRDHLMVGNQTGESPVDEGASQPDLCKRAR